MKLGHLRMASGFLNHVRSSYASYTRPTTVIFHSPSRCLASTAPQPSTRKPRNKDIPFSMVRLVDPVTSQLHPPASLDSVLESIQKLEKPKDFFVELVSEKPEPIVKIMNKKELYTKMKEQKSRQKEAAKAREVKEIQLTWGVDVGDLQHKLKKVREELLKGNRVNLVYAPKRGHRPPPKDEMAVRAQETVDQLVDAGKEWKPRDVQKSTTVIYLQGDRTQLSSNPP